MQAADVMTRNALTVSPTTTIAQSIELMSDAHTRHLPLVSHGSLVGIVSDRDVRGSLAALIADDPSVGRTFLTQPISTIAQHDVRSVRAETDLHVVVDLLMECEIGALPVVGEDGHRFLGLITTTDLLQAFRRLL